MVVVSSGHFTSEQLNYPVTFVSDHDNFVTDLRQIGESDVSAKLAQGVFAGKHKSWAEQWLQEAQTHGQVVRDMETLALAREANVIASKSLSTSKSAKNAAWLAAVVAVCALVISLLALFADGH